MVVDSLVVVVGDVGVDTIAAALDTWHPLLSLDRVADIDALHLPPQLLCN